MENTPKTDELNREEVKQEQTPAEQNIEQNQETKPEEVILSRHLFASIAILPTQNP